MKLDISEIVKTLEQINMDGGLPEDVRGFVIDPITGKAMRSLRLDHVVISRKLWRPPKITDLNKFRPMPFTRFKKLNHIEYRLLRLELDAYQQAAVTALMLYAGYEDAIIRHDNGTVISQNAAARMSGFSMRKYKEVFRTLIKLNLVAPDKSDKGDRCYRINPWLIGCGKHQQSRVYELFCGYKVRSKGNRTWKDIEEPGQKGERK